MSRPQTDRAVAGAKTGPSARATIAILDFGSQYTQLIARRVRESRVYCEIVPHDITPEELRARNVIGVILSGGPASVYDAGAPSVDPRVINGDFPVLGICYGMQLMAHVLGGDVVAEGKREYGPATVEIADRGGIFEGLSAQERAWVSHGDTVRRPPDGFSVVARTTSVPIAAMTDGKTRYAVQFHPEVAHTPHGAEILRNFLYRVCGASGDWTPAAFVEEAVAEIRERIGDRHAICALSGGVDSAVAAALVARAIGDRLTCVFVDTGLLRANEAAEVVATLRRLFKDEVRRVGAELGIPEDILWRHPFPGPGLAVRMLGPIDHQGLDTLRKADAIFLEELRAADLYRTVAQAFAVLTPVRSVGVQGDFRTYGALVGLRAVTTEDFMTADWARLPYDLLERVSARIVNEVPGVNRVVYDVSSKPPATIEWE